MTTSVTSVASTTSSTSLLAANGTRRHVVIRNTDANPLYFLQGGGVVTTENATAFLAYNESVEIWGDEAKEAFSGIWTGDGTGNAAITATLITPLASSYPLLTLIKETCDLLGLSRPNTVISSSDVQIRQLLALAIEEAEEQATSFNWQNLVREVTFETLPVPEQPGAVPSDLDRFISNSFYNRSTRRHVLGPVNAQEWQAIQANPQLNRIVLAFRERDGAFLMTPTPPEGETIAYEYVTNQWACSSDLITPRTRWEADTDLTYLDPSLLKLGIRWRWKKTKGLPYGEDFETYSKALSKRQARDGGLTAISMTGGSPNWVSNPGLPETGFGS